MTTLSRKDRPRRKFTRSDLPQRYHRIFDILVEWGLDPYVFHVARTGSCYIKFMDEDLRSLRLANHNNIEKYRYKWNYRIDIQDGEPWLEVDGNVVRYFYPKNKAEQLANDMFDFSITGIGPMLKRGR